MSETVLKVCVCECVCETGTRIVRACQAPWQPLQNHSSWHLGRWATLWSAEQMLDGQRQRVDIRVHARTTHNGHSQKKTERGSLMNRPPCTPSLSPLHLPARYWTEVNRTELHVYLQQKREAQRRSWRFWEELLETFDLGRGVESETYRTTSACSRLPGKIEPPGNSWYVGVLSSVNHLGFYYSWEWWMIK